MYLVIIKSSAATVRVRIRVRVRVRVRVTSDARVCKVVSCVSPSMDCNGGVMVMREPFDGLREYKYGERKYVEYGHVRGMLLKENRARIRARIEAGDSCVDARLIARGTFSPHA